MFASQTKEENNPLLNGSSTSKGKKIVRALSNKTDSLPLSFRQYQSVIFSPRHHSGILVPWTEKSVFASQAMSKFVPGLSGHFTGIALLWYY